MAEQQRSPIRAEMAATYNALEARLFALESERKFNDLLELAENIYLTHSPETPAATEPSQEDVVVSRLGLRGLKQALEFRHSGLSYSRLDEPEESDELLPEELQDLPVIAPISDPQLFSGPFNKSVATRVEAFGAELMRESFAILGQDAYQKVAELSEATSADEQIAVIEWLNNRLWNIVHDAPEDDDPDTAESRLGYHPIKMSPKFIGHYPDLTLQPSCLGVSTIAASFLERAGLKTLHANVATSTLDQDSIEAVTLVYHTLHIYKERFGIEPSPLVQKALIEKMAELSEYVTREEAHHVAVYTELLDGAWMQVDPNFRATTVLNNSKDKKRLTEAHHSMSELAAVAPGLETSIMLQGFIRSGELGSDILRLQSPDIMPAIIAAIRAELEDDNTESLPQRIFETSIIPFFTQAGEDERLASLLTIITTDAVVQPNGHQESALQAIFYKYFDKYILWDDDIDTFKQRLDSDPHYFEDRVADIASFPAVMLSGMALLDAKYGGLQKNHTIIETGLPASRIGMAVLSDLAQHTDYPLPASFWLSHWPSNVAIYENIQGASASDGEDDLVSRNAKSYERDALTSSLNYNIIKEFLQQRSQPKGEEDAQDLAETAG